MEDARPRREPPAVLAGVSARLAREEPRVLPAPPPLVPRAEFAPGPRALDRRLSAAGEDRIPYARAALAQRLEPQITLLLPPQGPSPGVESAPRAEQPPPGLNLDADVFALLARAARRLRCEARRGPPVVQVLPAVRRLNGGSLDGREPAPLAPMEARGAPPPRLARRVRMVARGSLDPVQVPRVRRGKPGGALAETPALAALRRSLAPRNRASRVRPGRPAMEAEHAALRRRDQRGAGRAGPQAAPRLAQAPAFERAADLVARPPRGRSRRQVVTRRGAVEAASCLEAVHWRLGQPDRVEAALGQSPGQ